jgi:acetolactate synthase-1/2/3 large subunit
VFLPSLTAGAPRHDVLTLTGGAIGQGLPNAVGAAIACPDRPVIALAGDGSAMYTIQALWTMARERLNVTSVIFNNASYAILNVELQRVGASGDGEKARSQLDLSQPGIDFVQLGLSMGVHAVRAQTAEEFCMALENALRSPGPHLIEAVVPSAFSGLKLRLLPSLLGSLGKLPRPLARLIKRKVAP